ncbi:MAG: putative addiction module antidote protein [Armatimonadetes bacterium]|nr:putative addiction module antidote protein [Armatimonadota bacterium]
MPTIDLVEALRDEFRDPEFAAGYLGAALEDGGVEAFLVALRNVVRATGGMTDVAQRAMLGRESLYKALTETGNPAFRTVETVLEAVGVRLAFAPAAGRAAHGVAAPV